MSQFVSDFIKSISARQELHDKLTFEYITNKVSEDEEKKTRDNLQIFKHFKNDENLSEQHKLLILQITNKIVDYRDLKKIYGNLIGELGLDNLVNHGDGDGGEDGDNMDQMAGDDDENAMRQNRYDNDMEEKENYIYDDEDDDIPDDATIF